MDVTLHQLIFMGLGFNHSGYGRKPEVMDETLSTWIGKHMGSVARIALNLDKRPGLNATEIPGVERLLLEISRISRD